MLLPGVHHRRQRRPRRRHGAMGNLTSAEARLSRVGEVMAITQMSKAVDAATAEYPFLMDDVNGQPRTGKADVGADELTASSA